MALLHKHLEQTDRVDGAEERGLFPTPLLRVQQLIEVQFNVGSLVPLSR